MKQIRAWLTHGKVVFLFFQKHSENLATKRGPLFVAFSNDEGEKLLLSRASHVRKKIPLMD